MAKRTASAKKQARAGARRTVRNRAARSSVKTLIVKARRSLAESSSAADMSDRQAAAVEALSALDRAAAKGILHPRNAARRKSRLARQLAKVAAASSAAASASAASTAAPAPGGGKGKKAAAPAAAASSSKKK